MAVVVEIAFAVFCIITKSNHKKIRSIIKIVAFAGFVLLAVLPIIDWDSRYYAIAALLLLLAVIAALLSSLLNFYLFMPKFYDKTPVKKAFYSIHEFIWNLVLQTKMYFCN